MKVVIVERSDDLWRFACGDVLESFPSIGVSLDIGILLRHNNLFMYCFESFCLSWGFEAGDGLKVPPGVCNARRLCVWWAAVPCRWLIIGQLAPGILEPGASTGASLQPLHQTHFRHLPVHPGQLAVHTSPILSFDHLDLNDGKILTMMECLMVLSR